MLTPIKAVKRAIEACNICGNTTQPTKRTVLSNTKGKTKLGDDFQAYYVLYPLYTHITLAIVLSVK